MDRTEVLLWRRSRLHQLELYCFLNIALPDPMICVWHVVGFIASEADALPAVIYLEQVFLAQFCPGAECACWCGAGLQHVLWQRPYYFVSIRSLLTCTNAVCWC
jgi:hypothetical protein